MLIKMKVHGTRFKVQGEIHRSEKGRAGGKDQSSLKIPLAWWERLGERVYYGSIWIVG